MARALAAVAMSLKAEGESLSRLSWTPSRPVKCFATLLLLLRPCDRDRCPKRQRLPDPCAASFVTHAMNPSVGVMASSSTRSVVRTVGFDDAGVVERVPAHTLGELWCTAKSEEVRPWS